MSENEFSMGNGSSAHAAKEGGFNDSIFGRKISKPPTGEESSSGDRKNLVITCDDSDSQHMPPDGHHIGTPAKRTCRRDSEVVLNCSIILYFCTVAAELWIIFV